MSLAGIPELKTEVAAGPRFASVDVAAVVVAIRTHGINE
jgi:hypothetical protein